MFHRWLLAPSQIRRIFADGASRDVRVVVSLLLLFVGGGGVNLFDIYALCPVSSQGHQRKAWY